MSDRSFPLVGVALVERGPRLRAQQITCGRCGATDQVINTGPHKILPPVFVANKFRARGWRVGPRDRDDRCPDCVALETPPRGERLPMVKTPATVPPRSAEAILAGKVAYDLMFEHLDLEAHRYVGDWSDEKVAEQSKLSLSAVIALRADRFFDLAPPPVSAETELRRSLDGDLRALRSGLSDLARTMATVRMSAEVLTRDLRDLVAAEQKLLACEKALVGHVGGGEG